MKLIETWALSLLSAATISAAPLSDLEDVIPTPTFNSLVQGVNFAAAAYCRANVAPLTTPRTITCSGTGINICGNAAGAKIIGTFSNNAIGFVARSGSQIIVSFQGTTLNATQLVADFDFKQTNYAHSACAGCVVHQGYYTGWLAARSTVLALLDKALQMGGNSADQILVLGHSLGAAQATYAAVDIKAHVGSVKTTLYAYASPRSGNPAFAAWYNSNGPGLTSIYRVTHYKDEIPRIPKPSQTSLTGSTDHIIWQHFGPEYWINADALADQNAASIIELQYTGDVENQNGNAGDGGKPSLSQELSFTYLPDEHRHYLIQVSGGDTKGC